MADILDLLSDNSSNPKISTGKKGGFLSVLKKNSMLDNDTNKPSYAFDKPEENTFGGRIGIENDHSPERNNGGFSFKNKEDENTFSNTGNDFFKHSNSYVDNNNMKSRTSSGFFKEKEVPDEKFSAESFGLGRRRRTQMINNTQNYGETNNRNSTDINDASTRSPDANNRNWVSRRATNVISTIKEMEKDGDDDNDNNSNTFIPTLSNNSRRARGSILNNLKDNPVNNFREGSPTGGNYDAFDSTKPNTDDISGITFKNNNLNKGEINNNNDDSAPKTLLKSFKSSPTNQDKRENANNNFKFTEKDLSNQIQDVNLKTNNIDRSNKNFNKQETAMSFGGYLAGNKETNENQDSLRTLGNDAKSVNPSVINADNSDYYKVKLEKDYLESQVTMLKQKCDEEKKRSEDILSEEREKLKKKEQENYKYIEELRQKHKEEIKSLEEKHKETTKNLYEENKKIRSEIDKEIQTERERLNILHQSDLENQENTFKKNLEHQKKFFEEQNETLKKQLQQQIEFNKLANKVESSSKQIDDILNKFSLEKASLQEHEKISLESKERYLLDLEEKLREQEKALVAEKEAVIKMRKDFELRELEKKKETQEEKVRMEKEILRLQELQNSLKIMEFNAKEKYEREKLELTQKQAEMKIEVDSLKSEYSQRLNELEYQQKIFAEEKKFFEKSKEETLKNIEVKRSDLETKKRQVVEEEKERRERIKVLEEKEFYLREQFEEFENMKAHVEEARKKNEKDRQDCLVAFTRIKESIKTLDDRERKLEKEKEEIMKRFADFENEKAYVNSEKIKLEQAKSELRLRMQSIEALRMKYVTTSIAQPVGATSTLPQFAATSNFDLKGFIDVPLNIIPNPSSTNFYANKTASNFQNNLNLMEKLEQIPEALRVSKSISNTSMRKSFNADEYMYNLKLKLGSGDFAPKNDFESNSNFAQFIAKEKEYLKSQSKLNSNSNTNLNNLYFKNELESIQNQHLKSISNPNVSMNIYETISANLNKENYAFSGSQNNFYQSSTGNLNVINNTNNNANNFVEANINNRNDNMKIISENKDEFKSFSKDPESMFNQEEKVNALSNFAANPISPKLGMFTSSQLNSGNNSNSNNFFGNNNNNNTLNKNAINNPNVGSNSLGNAPSQNKKKNIFDDIEEIGGLDDLLPTGKNNNTKNKNESDFDI